MTEVISSYEQGLVDSSTGGVAEIGWDLLEITPNRLQHIRRIAAACGCLVLASLTLAAANARSNSERLLGYTPAFIPNDPGYRLSPIALQRANLPYAWAVTRGGPAITIAIVDSGVNPDPDFGGKLLTGYNFLDDNADTSDENGHGTAMASIAAAGLNNEVGVAGVCGECKILPVKVWNRPGQFSPALIEGINWAVAQGARIINLSIINSSDSGINAAIENAVTHGVTIVISAGNEGTSDPSSNPMASENPEAIRVGAEDFGGKRLALYSDHGGWVDVAAPTMLMADGPMAWPQGTSAAAAFTSGTIGLMLSCNTSLTPDRVKNILIQTSQKMAGMDVVAGGVIDPYQAVLAAGCEAVSRDEDDLQPSMRSKWLKAQR